MIIELFGPAGAGKTTFAHTLAERLREHGHVAEVVFTYRPGAHTSLFDRGGVVAAVRRVARAAFQIGMMMCRPLANAREFQTTARLLWLLPPRNIVWFVRFGQYIVRLSRVWNNASRSDRIIIFDQAFVQSVCSLALFHGPVSEQALACALNVTPKADLLIQIDAPHELLEARLSDRLRRENFMERLFEADSKTNLKAKPIMDRVSALLRTRGCAIRHVESFDQRSLCQAVERAEEEIVACRNGGTELAAAPPLVAARTVGRGPIEAGAQPKNVAGTGAQPDDPLETAAEKPDTGLATRLAHASIWAFLVYVSGAGLTCLAQFVVARLLGATSYGIYSYVLAWVTLLAYAAMMGFHVALLRFVPAYGATAQWSLARGILRFAFRRVLLAGSLVPAVGIPIVLAQSSRLPPEHVTSMVLGMAAVPIIAIYLTGASMVRTFGGVILALVPERLLRDALLLALVGAAAWWTLWPLNATLVMAALLISSAATLAVTALAALRLWPSDLRAVQPAYRALDWWGLAFPIMVMTGFEILMTRTPVFLLGWAGNIREAGVFALGFNLALLIALPRVAVNTFFSPTISALYARDDRAGMQSLFAKATILSLGGAAALAVPLLVLTGPLLRLFGGEFVAAVPIAQILTIGQIFAAATGPQQSLLTMTGHERSAAVMMIASAGLNIASCVVGIAMYGAIGAAIATAATHVVWSVAMAVYIYTRLNLPAGLIHALAEFRRSAWTRQRPPRWPVSAGD